MGIGIALWLERRFARVHIRALFRWSPERQARAADHPTAGGDISLLALDLGLSYSVLRGQLEAGPAGGLEVGSMRGSGFGVTDPGAGSAAWIAPWFGGVAAWRAGDWLAVRAEVALAAPLDRSTFALGGVGPVHTPSIVGLRGVLGAEVRIP